MEEDRLDVSSNPIRSVECVDFVVRRGNYATRKMVRELLQVGETEAEERLRSRLVRKKKSSRCRRPETVEVTAKPVP